MDADGVEHDGAQTLASQHNVSCCVDDVKT